MLNVHETLSKLDYFIDNEYLKNYCRLVETHRRTKVIPKLTNKHHIVPKSWFKLTKKEINNELNNLVNLPYREHVLAHYYLCLCTTDPFMYANQLALICLVSRKKLNSVDKYLIKTLPLYNNIYENYSIKNKNNYKIYTEWLS